MKRNEERIPGFDEIVFRNRNREYGAYDLRRRNKSVTSLSMLGTITVCTAVLLILGMKTGDVKGDDHGGIIVIVQPEIYTPPKTDIPEVEPPKGRRPPRPGPDLCLRPGAEAGGRHREAGRQRQAERVERWRDERIS